MGLSRGRSDPFAALIPLLLCLATYRKYRMEYRKIALIRLEDTTRYQGGKKGKTAFRVATGS